MGFEINSQSDQITIYFTSGPSRQKIRLFKLIQYDSFYYEGRRVQIDINGYCWSNVNADCFN